MSMLTQKAPPAWERLSGTSPHGSREGCLGSSGRGPGRGKARPSLSPHPLLPRSWASHMFPSETQNSRDRGPLRSAGVLLGLQWIFLEASSQQSSQAPTERAFLLLGLIKSTGRHRGHGLALHPHPSGSPRQPGVLPQSREIVPASPYRLSELAHWGPGVKSIPGDIYKLISPPGSRGRPWP